MDGVFDEVKERWMSHIWFCFGHLIRLLPMSFNLDDSSSKSTRGRWTWQSGEFICSIAFIFKAVTVGKQRLCLLFGFLWGHLWPTAWWVSCWTGSDWYTPSESWGFIFYIDQSWWTDCLYSKNPDSNMGLTWDHFGIHSFFRALPTAQLNRCGQKVISSA